MDADKMVTNYFVFKDEKARIKKEADGLIARLDTAMDNIETKLLKHLLDNKVRNMGTDAGTFYIEQSVKPSCSDWGAYREWMIENDALDGVEKRVTHSFIKEYMKDNPEPPPGITVLRENVVRIRTRS